VGQHDGLLGEPLLDLGQLTVEALLALEQRLRAFGEVVNRTAAADPSPAVLNRLREQVRHARRDRQGLCPLLKLDEATLDLEDRLVEPLVGLLERLVLALNRSVKGALPEERARRGERDHRQNHDTHGGHHQTLQQAGREPEFVDLPVGVRNDDDGAVTPLHHRSDLLLVRSSCRAPPAPWCRSD
jgi:hypothetical protein